MAAMYPKQVVFTTTECQFDRLQSEVDKLREAGAAVSRADLLREALDIGLERAVKLLGPKSKRSRR